MRAPVRVGLVTTSYPRFDGDPAGCFVAEHARYLETQGHEVEVIAAGEPTGEGRVRAARDRRAGDRAVETWARQNSAVLRQLAGQVSGLDGLSAEARRQADEVGRALADNNPAALLSPLAGSQSPLEDSHAGLAERIKSVTDHTDRLRQGIQDTRGGRAKPTGD
jgi:hypothetical protein